MHKRPPAPKSILPANAAQPETAAKKPAAPRAARHISRWANVARPAFQLGRKVNASGDKEEQEAGHTVSQVMQMPETAVQPKAAEEGGPVSTPPINHEAMQQPGRPLDTTTRHFMESRFGQDFGRVRISADEAANQMARGLDAQAFTYGEHISFASGKFAPQTTDGRHLLAHELAHVIQQRGSGRAKVARQAAQGSLVERATNFHLKLAAAQTSAEVKPLLPEALKLAGEAAAAIAVANTPNAPSGSPSADDIRDPMKRIGRSLVDQKEIDTAGKFAEKSQDVDIKQAIVNYLRSPYKGVSGQQTLLIRLGTFAGIPLTAPSANETSAQWLDKNTATIGKIYTKLDAMGLKGLKGSSLGLELSGELLEQYFVYSDYAKDPEPLGKLTHLTIDATSKQIEADCDVWATYGARLLREQGWTTVGYMGVFPDDPKASDPSVTRDAHAVALAKKANSGGGWDYLGVSNWNIKSLLTGGTDDAKALPPLRDLMFDVYDPKLQKYKIYYLAAKTGGAYDDRLKDPVANKLQTYETKP